jgi:hypothetical protein
MPAITPKLLIRLVNVSDLHAEPPNLVSKGAYIIHTLTIPYLESFQPRLQ